MPRKRGQYTLDIDVHVAKRLRAARQIAGVSQEKAAKLFGITFQQIQKYENGSNRVSAGKLALLAQFYKLPVTWFFEGDPGLSETAAAHDGDRLASFLTQSHAPELMRSFAEIERPQDRASLAQLAESLARAS